MPFYRAAVWWFTLKERGHSGSQATPSIRKLLATIVDEIRCHLDSSIKIYMKAVTRVAGNIFPGGETVGH